MKREKYRRKPWHKKKVRDDRYQNRESWRKYKGIDRDKARRLHIWGRCFSDGPQPWLKRVCNKAYRRHEKLEIYRENWDNLHPRELRLFLNPWMWT